MKVRFPAVDVQLASQSLLRPWSRKLPQGMFTGLEGDGWNRGAPVSRQRAPAGLELGPIREVHGRPPIVPGCFALHFVELRLGKDRTLESGIRDCLMIF